MQSFKYCQPTEVLFGWGRTDEIGNLVSEYGNDCLMVTGHTSEAKYPLYDKVKKLLRKNEIEVVHFDEVETNPTTDMVNKGAEIAIDEDVDVVLGVGGGSSMDTAKAIAVGATHQGKAWEYRLFTEKDITEDTLPIITLSTTSGTGSQVTPFSVVTNSKEESKFALADLNLSPQASIVDPQLMVTVPDHITASTGFDAFFHAFESYIHEDASPFTDLLAKEAMQKIIRYLPLALEDGTNKRARSKLAWADTLAGTCISNAGTVLPHGIAMAIGGHAPDVLHGEALAVIYPEFMQYTYPSATKKFAELALILNPKLSGTYDESAAKKSVDELSRFLKETGMLLDLKELGVPRDKLPEIAEDSLELPDYKGNPRIADKEDILNMLESAYEREEIN